MDKEKEIISKIADELDKLKFTKEQLANAQLEATRLFHNINATIVAVERLLDKLGKE